MRVDDVGHEAGRRTTSLCPGLPNAGVQLVELFLGRGRHRELQQNGHGSHLPPDATPREAENYARRVHVVAQAGRHQRALDITRAAERRYRAEALGVDPAAETQDLHLRL